MPSTLLYSTLLYLYANPTGLNDLLRHMPTGLDDLLRHMPTGLNDLWASGDETIRNSEFLYETSFDYAPTQFDAGTVVVCSLIDR